MYPMYFHHRIHCAPRTWKAVADHIGSVSAQWPASGGGALYGVWRSQIGRPRDELTVITVWQNLPADEKVAALFTGMVLALQIFLGSARFNAESAVASIVVIGITRELGPVIAGLMVAGRVGAAIAAEIGTMRVTEQIDALVTLSTNPFRYLVAPRLMAAALTLPVLVLIGDAVGVFGAYLVGTLKLGFTPHSYLSNTADFLETQDVVSGLVKAAVFGYLIALMGCYHGYYSKGGAQGVGAAATNAVVSASILLLSADYLLTEIFFVQ